MFDSVKRFSLSNQNQMQERVSQLVLVLDGTTFYPHYRLPEVWCGPGTTRKHDSNTWSTAFLLHAGAKWHSADLWPRNWTKHVIKPH
jgi:hypothetical protein